MAYRQDDPTITATPRKARLAPSGRRVLRYRAPGYPWASWADGHSWVLTFGTDYNVGTYAIRQSAYAAARQRGLKAVTHVWFDGKSSGIILTFVADANTPEEVIDL